MSLASSLDDALIASLEQRKQAIWNEDWSEDRRQQAWAQHTTRLQSYLAGENTKPRTIRPDPAAPPKTPLGSNKTASFNARKRMHEASQYTATTPMARSISTSDGYTGPPVGRFTRPRHASMTGPQPPPMDFSNSYTYGTTPDWRPATSTALDQQQQNNSTIFDDPRDFIAQFNACTDSSQSAAKRQRLDGLNTSCVPSPNRSYMLEPRSSAMSSSFVPTPSSISPGLTPSSYRLSPCSSFLPPGGEDMSRQSSMSNASVADALDMMRFDSSSLPPTSNCTSFPFAYGQEQQQQDIEFGFSATASDVSCATEKPVGGSITGFGDEGSALMTDISSFASEDFPFAQIGFPSVAVDGPQWQQLAGPAISLCQGQEMERNFSQDSCSSGDSFSSAASSTAELKATERRRKHIENSKQPLAPKTIPRSVPDTLKSSPEVKAEKQAIPKVPYQRPQHPKLLCDQCSEYPNGFRGEHELRRHYERAHATKRKVWICVEPPVRNLDPWPAKPLNICKQCKQRKQYNVYYNAAAHLRRGHFCPRKRGRRARGEERESRAGKAGGDWPSIDWLKANGWLQEIEVEGEQLYEDDAPDAGEESATEMPTADSGIGMDVFAESFNPDGTFPSHDFQQTSPQDVHQFQQQPLNTQGLDLTASYPLQTLNNNSAMMLPSNSSPSNTRTRHVLPSNGHLFNAANAAPMMQHSISAPGALPINNHHNTSQQLYTQAMMMNYDINDLGYPVMNGYTGL